ncbi:MAG: hypothetical protein J07HX5_02135 [halophilic archaeon J07HX5]|nr:MAG: hypothetical protein J07HX5_02135 [halophilic archaeon J07HX5]
MADSEFVQSNQPRDLWRHTRRVGRSVSSLSTDRVVQLSVPVLPRIEQSALSPRHTLPFGFRQVAIHRLSVVVGLFVDTTVCSSDFLDELVYLCRNELGNVVRVWCK